MILDGYTLLASMIVVVGTGLLIGLGWTIRDAIARKILRIVDRYRAKKGLPPLNHKIEPTL